MLKIQSCDESNFILEFILNIAKYRNRKISLLKIHFLNFCDFDILRYWTTFCDIAQHFFTRVGLLRYLILICGTGAVTACGIMQFAVGFLRYLRFAVLAVLRYLRHLRYYLCCGICGIAVFAVIFHCGIAVFAVFVKYRKCGIAVFAVFRKFF